MSFDFEQVVHRLYVADFVSECISDTSDNKQSPSERWLATIVLAAEGSCNYRMGICKCRWMYVFLGEAPIEDKFLHRCLRLIRLRKKLFQFCTWRECLNVGSLVKSQLNTLPKSGKLYRAKRQRRGIEFNPHSSQHICPHEDSWSIGKGPPESLKAHYRWGEQAEHASEGTGAHNDWGKEGNLPRANHSVIWVNLRNPS